MNQAIRAEYRKLRTTRTTGGLLAALGLLTGLGIFGDLSSASPRELAGGLSAPPAYAGVLIIAMVFVVVLGIRSFTDEVRHGSVMPTFLATPDRGQVVLAKTAVAAMAAVVFATVSLAVATAAIVAFLTIHGIGLAFSLPVYAGLAAKALAIAVLWAVLGVAVGTIVRHQVAAIVGALAWLFVAENIIGALAPSVARFLPASATAAAAGIATPGMTELGGFLVLAAWAVAGAALAVVAVRRRDVV